MNDIENYLDQACQSINGPDDLREHLRQELEEHLEEAIEALMAEGASREEATRQAMEGLGEPESIRDGMESVYNPGVTSLFVDKAIQWRDRKWHITTQLGLASIVAIAIGVTTFMLVFIVPVLKAIHDHLGIEFLPFLANTIGIAEMVWTHWWIGLLVLTGGLGLFEWKCRSDNKAHMRTTIGVGLSLLSVLAAFWLMGVIAVGFSMVTPVLASAGRQAISPTPVPYGDHYYQVFDVHGIEWDDAKTRCETLGGYLVIINDAEENSFLTSIGASSRRRLHLGASYAENEGDWRWVDGSPMTYQNWFEGAPLEGPKENYLSVKPVYWPKWSGGPSRAHGFICEWDSPPETNAAQREEDEIRGKR